MADRYTVRRAIRRGATAEILEAVVCGAGGFERRVAIKRLLPELAGDEVARVDFLDEARLLARLSHANIVHIFDFGTLDDLPFQALELVDGMDLDELGERARAANTRVPVPVALHIATEVARALEYAHGVCDDAGRRLGIVHRDVTPKNILIGWNGDVKLADFGVAFADDRNARTRAGEAKGTPAYMSPEQARGARVDARTDVYALGWILYELVAGHLPTELPDARMKIFAGARPEWDANVAEDVVRIVERATRFSKEQRYLDASELAFATWSAFVRHAKNEGRCVLQSWLEPFRRNVEPRSHPVAGLFDFTPADATGEAGLGGHASLAQPARTKAQLPSIGAGASPMAEGAVASRKISAFGDDETESDPLARVVPSVRGAPSEDPLVGTVVHGYRIAERIGKGGYSRVYRAVHEILSLESAVKVLLDQHLTESGVRRFRREAQILCSLRHPNLVSVIDCGTMSSGSPFFMMELLRGRSLKEVLRSDGALEPARAGRILGQVAAGLAAAHGHGLVHRDLKPGNIMLIDDNGVERAKLVDFGIARGLGSDAFATRLTRADQFLGTPNYASPEQIHSPSTVGPATDLYSLGVVLYAMLTGRPPFQGKSAEVIKKHLDETPAPIENAGGLERLAMDLLEKDPKKRPASANDVVRRLDELGLGEELPGTVRARHISGDDALRAPAPRGDTELESEVAREDSRQSDESLGASRSVTVTRRSMLDGESRRFWLGMTALAVATMLIAMFSAYLLRASPDGDASDGSITEVTSPRAVRTTPHATAVRDESSPGSAPAEPAMEGTGTVERLGAPARSPEPGARERNVEGRIADLERTLHEMLAKRGLELSDLDGDPTRRTSVARWRAALRANDVRLAKQSLDELIATAENVRIDEGLCRARFERARLHLERATARLSPEKTKALEERYLELRRALRSDATQADYARLATSASMLDAAIAREEDAAR